MQRPDGLLKAIEAAGGINALGRKLNITGQAVQQWTQVPAERAREIEDLTGVPRHVLRPDLWDEVA